MSTHAISRTHFIRGKYQGSSAVRPPWAIDEVSFIDACSQCYECAKACPSHLIVKGVGGFPEMSFSRHGCDYCEACVRACPEEVLEITPQNQQHPWQQIASVSDGCFAKRGVVCRSCGEICEARAIQIKPQLAGRSQIIIDATACNGCGECVHVCPAHAIEIQKNPVGEIHE